MVSLRFFAEAVTASLAVGIIGALVLLAKSLADFSRAGPQLQSEIVASYRTYLAYSLARLTFWALVILWTLGLAGALLYGSVTILIGIAPTFAGAMASAALGAGWISAVRFLSQLFHCPATIAASLHYRQSRLYPMWALLSPARVKLLQWGSVVVTAIVFGAAAIKLMRNGEIATSAVMLLALTIALVAITRRAIAAEPRPISACPAKDKRPNILMIGSDTLRADRLGAAGYRRALTPRLDALAARGVQFTECYVPCARTAPSLLSLFTGCWPHTHGVRDNFVPGDRTHKRLVTLPKLLATAGYSTTTIADWAGSDLEKFDLGFEHCDVPPDQWNIKYLLRQGPKDLRLFLSLFTGSSFGKRFLPEIHYLAGVPLTRQIGRQVRRKLSEFAASAEPFLLNVFMATTHPPFGSEYPYYTSFADRNYGGESKFVMARLNDPFEIIRRQGDTRKDFDLDQIIDLYDGCVKSFDDEVGRILDHLDACGLTGNTIVVIYSDHGMELFEHATWGQGNSVVGDFSAKIPLIIAGPNAGSGQRVDEITRSIDIAPTLLELAGIHQPTEMEGVSLCATWRGTATHVERAAFNETGIWFTTVPGMPAGHLHYPDLQDILDVPDKRLGTLAIKPEFADRVLGARDRMIRKGHWKLVYQPLEGGAVYRLFDTSIDPGYNVDLAANYPEVVAQLSAELLEWINAGRTATASPDERPLT